jgi:hypothetical protein
MSTTATPVDELHALNTAIIPLMPVTTQVPSNLIHAGHDLISFMQAAWYGVA